MNYEITKLGAQHLNRFQELIYVFEDVFEMENFKMPSNNHLQLLLNSSHFMAFVAISNNQVVGGLTAYMLQQYYSTSPLVYVYDLAVKTDLQRQGIGKALMLAINNHCQEIGVEEVFVQADEADGYALDFYKSTGGTPEKVVHFCYPLK
ncbi:MAG: GNAT family N-acetyltransferase [Sphingobacteriaceae bacterium]